MALFQELTSAINRNTASQQADTAENALLRREIVLLRDAVHDLRNETQSLRMENAGLRTDVSALRAEISEVKDKLTQLLLKLSNLPDPGPVSLLIISEDQNVLNFKINLPELPPEPNDIVSGELILTINGTSQTITTAKDQRVVESLSGEQGQTVTATFAYVDDADNRSAHPAMLSVVLADTLPPADPGAITLDVTSET